MKITQRTHAAGFPVFEASFDGHEVIVSAFGAQLLEWRKDGVEVLFSNRGHAIDDGKTAYRGGAPACFPYFGRGTLLPLGTTLNPQHGAARTTVWEHELGSDFITFRTQQPSPEGYGPTTLEAELTYRFGDGIWIDANVTNVGEASAPFQLAIHSYWACANPAEVAVTGLGVRYLDNLRGFAEDVDPAPDALHTPPFDRVYLDAAELMTITTDRYRLSIETKGCAGAVLWNPGEAHPIADLGRPGFICVESGVIIPGIQLAPGATHGIQIRYSAAQP